MRRVVRIGYGAGEGVPDRTRVAPLERRGQTRARSPACRKSSRRNEIDHACRESDELSASSATNRARAREAAVKTIIERARPTEPREADHPLTGAVTAAHTHAGHARVSQPADSRCR